ncbi:sulfatase [Catalinimonas sp. 4WD22]|uniref:sulfatase family protein n=1 Tax=Catalinimonas locisalis TaxID=3133978 RepID=UPI003100B135
MQTTLRLRPLFYIFISCLISIFLISCQTQQAENQPAQAEIQYQNIVVIIGDDHSANVLGTYGNDIIKTPNLDRMASRGVQFNRAYANAPLCSASRQSILTGLYPHAAGVTLLTTPFPEEKITLADHLQNYGYTSAIIGKNHFNNQLNHGFNIKIERSDYNAYMETADVAKVPDSIPTRPPWKPFRDPARVWLNSEMLPGDRYDEYDIGTWYADQANDFLEQHQDSSFLLWVGFHEPHSPFNFPVEYQNRYKPDEVPFPEGSAEDDRWIPDVFRDLTEEERKGIIASYYTSVEYLDKNVGLILDKIESLGLGENTLVIYIGDHGYLLNDHKRFEKHMMWEPAIRAPLIVQGGSQLEAGKKIDAMAEYVDLVPTLLEATQNPLIEGLQGKSLMPIIKGDTNRHKEYIFSEFLADNKAMVRGERFKYIFTTGKRDLGQGYETGYPAPGITHRLYDVVNDPDETTNLYTDPEYTEELRKMQEVMLQWFENTHPKADSIQDDWEVERRLIAFCEPPDKQANLSAR